MDSVRTLFSQTWRFAARSVASSKMTRAPSHIPPSTWAQVIGLIGWILLSFSASSPGVLFMPGEWYASLKKPSWNPPSWVFGPVWTTLYTLMGIAAWMIWRRGGFAAQRRPLTWFLLQLGLNTLWTPLFFGWHQMGIALLEITLLWIALLLTIRAFHSTCRVASRLLWPYLVWVSFATILNFELWRLNR